MTPATLLQTLDEARDLRPTGQAVLLCERSSDPRSTLSWVDAPIGRRNAQLLRLRAAHLGRTARCLTRCGGCGEKLEVSIALDDLLGAGATPISTDLEIDGHSLRLRPITSRDILALETLPMSPSQARFVVERCLEQVSFRGEAIAPEDLPDAIIDAAMKALEALDPLAIVEIDTCCRACGASSQMLLNVTLFVVAELDELGRHLLWEIHRLASHYGWSEERILSLHPWRRRHYLELIGP